MAEVPVKTKPIQAESRICHFVRNPTKECYCAELSSYSIAMILRYCENNFEQCEIYQRLHGKDEGGRMRDEG